MMTIKWFLLWLKRSTRPSPCISNHRKVYSHLNIHFISFYSPPLFFMPNWLCYKFLGFQYWTNMCVLKAKISRQKTNHCSSSHNTKNCKMLIGNLQILAITHIHPKLKIGNSHKQNLLVLSYVSVSNIELWF